MHILSDLFSNTLRIFSKHWLIFTGFALTLTAFSLSIETEILKGMDFAILVPLTIIIVIASILLGLASLKFSIDTTKTEQVSLGEALSYGAKNLISFIWASLIGTLYAMKWALLVILGIPAAYAILQTVQYAQVQATETVSAARVMIGGGLGMLFAFLGIIAIIYMIYIGIKMSFLGYAFVDEGKRGTDAVKRSMELVTGRWWMTFGYFLIFGVIGSVVIGIMAMIIQLIAGEKIIVDSITSILGNVVGIMLTIFGALLFHEYKKDPR